MDTKKELENTAAKLSAKESELSAAETRVASLETQLGEASTVARRAQTASDQAEARASSAAEELAQLKLKSATQSRDDDDRLDEMYQEMDALRADAEKLERGRVLGHVARRHRARLFAQGGSQRETRQHVRKCI